jgi:hypothetical protein
VSPVRRSARSDPPRAAARNAVGDRQSDVLPAPPRAVRVPLPTINDAPRRAALPALAAAAGPRPVETVTGTSGPAAKAKAAASATPSAAPGLGSFSAMLRLNLEDLLSGSGKPSVTNPTAVVTGLFQETLRRDPTPSELQTYLKRLKMTGVNGVVAGLYTSDAFRQNSVNNYYLELLSRTPMSQELKSGSLRLALGSATNFAASLVASQEFFTASASGGGKFGTQPSANTYVDLLYRSMLGESIPPNTSPQLAQRIEAGLPISRAARQFVNSEAYRAVKVKEVFQVLGQQATPNDIAGYVKSWLWNGGQSGISQSLLATSDNVQRLEAGLVSFPDSAAAADLQELLLATYNDSADGFTKLFNSLLSLDPSNPIGKDNPCSLSNTSCNRGLYQLVTSGGRERGIPNGSLAPNSGVAKVATLIPTQNEIDLRSSLRFPLQDPDQLATYFAGGIITPFGNPIVTANNGTYIVDGHHRWSQILLINPYTQVTTLDLGYVPTPQDALKEAQMGVIATKGYLASATVQGENLYTISETDFNTAVQQLIVDGPKDAEVRAVFGKYLGFDSVTAPLPSQFATIQNYLWANVLQMRNLNPFIPGAPSRSVMPQTDPLPVTQGYWASGNLSYSFPTISYLG